MKILVIGASGLVGSYCLNEARSRGHQTEGTFCRFPVGGLRQLDVECCLSNLKVRAEFSRFLAKFRPEAVIYCAAWAWVDGCERDPDKARRCNAEHPSLVAEMAREMARSFVYFSSSYIFDGRLGPYSEVAAPNPISAYGRSKLEGEKVVSKIFGRHAIIVRTMGVYGHEEQRKNFVYQLTDRLRRGEQMKVPNDQEGNATYAQDLARAVLALVERGKSGVWNLAGPEPCLNRMQFARVVCDAFGLPVEMVKPVPTVELGQAALRPLRGGLLTGKISRMYEFRSAHNGLLDWVTQDPDSIPQP